MAKVYGPPRELPVPEMDFEHFDWKAWQRTEAEYIGKLRQYCTEHGSGDCKGETITFPVADGHAIYMVYSLSPAVLIHIPLGDAWQYRGIEHFSARGLRQEVQRQREWSKLWSGKKEEGAAQAAA
jgi:hypothetical protein